MALRVLTSLVMKVTCSAQLILHDFDYDFDYIVHARNTMNFSGNLTSISQMYVTRVLYPASFVISVLVLDKIVETYSCTHSVPTC